MTDKLIDIDSSGIKVASLEGAKTAFENSVVNAFGGNVDKHVHTPQMQFAAINASVWAELGEELLRAVTYGADLDLAPGKFLDAMGSLLDIRRRPATKTKVICQARGVAGTVIQKGSIVQDVNDNRFISDDAAAIPSGGASVSISFTAIDEGPIEVEAGGITKIVSVRNGWETIGNEEPGVAGTNRESDAEYRANIKARTAHNATASVSAMESALSEAGATKYKVIENPSNSSADIGGVSIPPHSVVVAVSGGLSDDIARAVNNARGMGINVHTAVEGSEKYDGATASAMNAARFRFNGKDYSDIDLSGTGSIFDAVTILNAYPNKPDVYPTFSTNGETLLAFYDWNIEAEGFEDVGGSPSPSVMVEEGLHAKSAFVYRQTVRVSFTEPVEDVGRSSSDRAVVKYKAAGSSTFTTITTTNVNILRNRVTYTLASEVPDDATEIMLDFTDKPRAEDLQGGEGPLTIPLTMVSLNSGDAPTLIDIWVDPRAGGVYFTAHAFQAPGNDIVKWQYRRFDGVNIIAGDAQWVDIANSASTLVGATLTGYTNNNIGARVEVRAVATNGQSTIAHSSSFTPTATAPTITGGSADGESIILSTSTPLHPFYRSGTGGWTVSLSSGASRSVTSNRLIGDRIYLRLNSSVPEGDTITLSYAKPSGGSLPVQGYSRVEMANISNVSLNNITIDKVPSRPSFVRAWRTYPSQAGTSIAWESNADGGSSVDRYEYRYLMPGTSQWSDWLSIDKATARSHSFLAATDSVQMRSSNPNVRFAEVFGIGNNSPVFVRSVKFPLSIGIDLAETDGLTGNIIDNIRSAIINHINSYGLGERIWANDIFALVERIAGTEVKFNSSDTYVKYRNVGVNAANAYSVPFYAEWLARPSDISIVFTS